MVESKARKDSPKRRTRSSSSSSSGSSSSTTSSGSGSSSSSSAASRSPTPKKTRTGGRDERAPRRSPPRRSRSPRRVAPKTEKTTVSSSRRSPSPNRRRQASPDRARHRSRSPRRERERSPVRRERALTPPIKRERSPEPPPRRICVRNLSRNVTKAHLEEIFALFGAIKSCELPMDRVHLHLPRGYGYVEYESAEDAEKAMKHMDGGQVDGVLIQCEMTLPYRAGGGGGDRGPSPVGLSKRAADRSSRSPPRRSGGAVGRGGASPSRRPRHSRSPLPRGGGFRATGTGSNTIPLGGRYR